jgi:K+-transporting ATPase A subunit
MKKLLSLFVLTLAAFPLAAQQPEMADTMRSEGKIYVVVTVLVVILGGLLTYVIALDRKATRLEKKLDELRSR